MALKDCLDKFQKAGVPIAKADVDKLAEFIGSGMSDTEAVRALKVEWDSEVVDIASKAQEAGARLNVRSDVLGEVRSFAGKVEQRLRSRLAELQELSRTDGEISTAMQDIDFNEGVIASWEPGGATIDVHNDQDLMTRINQMFFHPATGDNLRAGKLSKGLPGGKTQQDIFDSFREMQQQREDLRMHLIDLLVEGQTITDKLNDMTGKKPDEYFQSVIGFTSGVLTAAQTMPNAKGPANEMLALLKKQPGVTPGELGWLDLETWLQALDKGVVTREEIVAYVQANGIEVEETQYGGEMPQRPHLIGSANSFEEAYTALGIDPNGSELIFDYTNETSAHHFSVIVDEQAGNVSVTPDDGKTWLKVREVINIYGEKQDQTLLHAEDAMIEYILMDSGAGFAGPPMHTGQTLGGGTNQREILLRTPRVDDNTGEVRMSGSLVILFKSCREQRPGWMCSATPQTMAALPSPLRT